MGQTLQFIDQASMDAAARKRIRVHAATGKNLGRKLNRPCQKSKPTKSCEKIIPKERQGLPVTQLNYDTQRAGSRLLVWTSPLPKVQAAKQPLYQKQQQQQQQGQETDEELMARGYAPSIRNDGDEMTLMGLHTRDAFRQRPQLVRRALEYFSVVKYFPEIKDCHLPEKSSRGVCVRFMCHDEACMHVNIAAAIVSLNDMVSEKVDMTIALEHLSIAMRLINLRLGGSDAISNVNIAIVSVFAQIERHRHRVAAGQIHLDAMEKMINMRGGIRMILKESRAMAQKLMRLDLEFALNLGTLPRFTFEDMLADVEASTWLPQELGSAPPDTDLGRIADLPGLDEQLGRIATDMTGFAWLFNDAKAGTRRLPFFISNCALLVLQYRLLELAPLSLSSMMSRLDHAIHLGLVACTMPFIHGMGGMLVDSPLLTNPLIQIIHEEQQDESENGLLGDEILLWLAFALCICTPRMDGKTFLWLAETVSGLRSRLQLDTWEDVSESLARYPWIHAMHGNIGWKLYNMSQEVRKRQR